MSDISTPNHWHIYASTEPGKAILAVNADGTVILHGREVVQSHAEKEAVKSIFAGFMKDAPSVREAVEAERGRAGLPDGITPDSLVERAVRMAKNPGEPKWAAVKDVFGHGSTYSVMICRAYGLDPEETEPWEDDDDE